MEDQEMSPPLPSSISSTNSPEFDNFSLHFASMYHSIFPPLISSSSSSLSFTPLSSDDDPTHHYCTAPAATSTTDDLLFHARIVLEHRELRQRHDLCLRRLHLVADDNECLRRENGQLRLANAELVKVISSKTAVEDLVAIPNNSDIRTVIGEGQIREEVCNYDIISPTSVIGKYNNNHFDGRNYRRRFSLPKSVAVRSPAAAAAPLNVHSSRMCGTMSRSSGGNEKKEEEEMKLEIVYNQGMTKTELCNKWRETGRCSYGEHCRFSHGVEELRPVIRHPRYKTQMCRMILTGLSCPYAHRCHFRHSLAQAQ